MSHKSGVKSSNKMSKFTQGSIRAPSSRRDNGSMSRSSSVSTITSVVDSKSDGDAGIQNAEGFVLGDRVWVNGTKPGFIQFIGETQFAPGLWAGVKLDEEVGKNDGSVAGVKYFTCEPQRGIFARPHRLTRLAGSPPDIAENSTRVSSGTKTRDILTSAHGASPGSTLSSPSKPGCSKLKVGERVVVNATSGTKTGILRYFGVANFAPGDWAGIELDQPLGKNDGSVAGKRYFECKMKHGLFAPPHKVSRAGGTSTPRSSYSRTSSLHNRSSSRESLNSSVSSASATRSGRVKLGVTSLTNSQRSSKAASASVTATHAALQEALKEKEEHIEQLLKEMDLERGEVARAAGQVEEAERKICDLKTGNQHYVDETESQIMVLKEIVEKSETERKTALALLDEERRKIEDLQFRLEEETIMKSELEIQAAKDLQDIKQLKELLDESGKKSGINDDDPDNILHSNVFQLQNLLETKSKELSCAEDKILKLVQELQLISDNGINREEMMKEREKLVEALKIELQQSKENLKAKEDEINSIKEVSSSKDIKQSQITQANEELRNLANELEQKLQCLAGDKMNLTNEVCELKNLVNSYECEKSEREGQVTWLKNSIQEKDAQLQNLANELQSSEINAVSEETVENNLLEHKLEKERMVKESEEKINKLNDDLKNLSTVLAMKENLLRENEMQIENLKKCLEEQKSDLLTDCLKNADEKFALQVENNTVFCNMLEDNIANMKAEHEKMKIEKEKEIADFMEKLANLSMALKEKEEKQAKLESEVNSFTKCIEEKDTLTANLHIQLKEANDTISSLAMDQSAYVNQLQSQISVVKAEKETVQTTLEKKLEEMAENSKKMSIALKENEELQIVKESEIVSLKTCLEDKDVQLLASKSLLAEVQDQLQHLVEESKNNQNLLQKEIAAVKVEKEQDLKAKDEALKKVTQEYDVQTAQLQDTKIQMQKLDASISTLQKELAEKDVEISNLNTQWQLEKEQVEILSKDKTEKQNFLQQQIARIRAEADSVLNDKEKCLEGMKIEVANCMSVIETKNQEVIVKQKELQTLQLIVNEKESQISQLSELIEINQKQLNQLQQQNADNTCLLERRVAEFKVEQEKHLQDKEKHLHEEIKKLQILLQNKESIVNDNEAKLCDLKLQMEKNENEKKTLQLTLEDTQAKLNAKLETEKFLHDVQSKIQILQDQYDKLLQEKDEIKNQEQAAQQARKELEKSKDTLLNDKIEQQALVKDRDAKLAAVQLEVDRMQTEFMRHKEELQQKLDVSEMELKAMKEIKTQLEVQHEVLEELQQQLTNTENERHELYLQVQNSSELAGEKARLEEKVTKLQKQLETKYLKIEEFGNQNCALEKALEEKNSQLQQKEIGLKTLQMQLELIQKDLAQSQKIKHSLEEEKVLLSDKVVKLQESSVETNRPTKVDVESDSDREEKETLLSQIDFLNSIIVDMRRKNDELKMQQESPPDLLQNDLNFNGIKSTIAPRLFCDICDMFDVHDTDDCPKQSSFEGDELEVPHSKHHGNRHEERPYCNNCEIFGHWTLDCDDQETF